MVFGRTKRGREKIKRDNIKVGRKRSEEKDISLEAVISLKEKGYGFRRIAEELKTSISTISRMLKRCDNGQIRNVPNSNSNQHKTDENSGGVSLKPLAPLAPTQSEKYKINEKCPNKSI